MSHTPVLIEPFIETVVPGGVMNIPMRKRCQRELRPYIDNLSLRAVGGSPVAFAIIFVPSGTLPQNVPTSPLAAFVSTIEGLVMAELVFGPILYNLSSEDYRGLKYPVDQSGPYDCYLVASPAAGTLLVSGQLAYYPYMGDT